MMQDGNSHSYNTSSLTANAVSPNNFSLHKPNVLSGISAMSGLSGGNMRDKNIGMRREGSDRKNPLVYFLGSANASVDTTNQ